MATVKLQNGNVVLKNGLVSCECCILGCCWYPAKKIADGSYSQADLPSTIRFYGEILTKISGQPAYGTLENGVRFQNNIWTIYKNGNISTRECLFLGTSGYEQDNNSIEDNFEDIYEANVSLGNNTGFESVLIYRVNYKTWLGVLSCGKSVSLVYQPCFFEPLGAKIWGQNSAPFWSLTWFFCNIPPNGQTGTTLPRLGVPTGIYGVAPIEVRIP
jgi:hypothetical protein